MAEKGDLGDREGVLGIGLAVSSGGQQPGTALDMVEADRTGDEAVVRYEVVRAAMDTALGTILTGFRYATRQPEFGFGHVVLQSTR